jgi:hypothetical protein
MGKANEAEKNTKPIINDSSRPRDNNFPYRLSLPLSPILRSQHNYTHAYSGDKLLEKKENLVGNCRAR